MKATMRNHRNWSRSDFCGENGEKIHIKIILDSSEKVHLHNIPQIHCRIRDASFVLNEFIFEGKTQSIGPNLLYTHFVSQLGMGEMFSK